MDLNEVVPVIGLIAVMVPVVAIDPALAVLAMGTTTLTTTPVLLVNRSAMLPAGQLTEMVEPLVVT